MANNAVKQHVASISEVNVNTKEENDPLDEERDNWSSRLSFWLGAIGAAVGLGNLWRFPYQCAKFGGGAFIFVYLICLFTIGMPLLTQELSLGQKHRSGDIEAFGRMNWRLRGIGLASLIGTFCIVTYYMVLIAVSAVFFFESFYVPLPYDDPNYFEDKILLKPDSIEDAVGIMNGKLFLAVTLCWVLTFICVHKGVKSASIAVKITMPLPFLLLFILLIKGLTLPGAGDGIRRYLDFSDWSELGNIAIWNAAIGQCFFSLGVCMGVMTAFGSYNPKTQDVATDEKIISFADLLASLMSGFVVYSVLGYIAKIEGDDSVYTKGGTGLVFETLPIAISTFKGANFFGIIFYLCLVLLGIDSAFSLIEALATVIFDSDLNKHRLKLSRPKITGAMCLCGFFGSCLFTFDSGIFWLDIVDRYVNNYGMIFMGFCECAACGWFYSLDETINQKIGQKSANIYRIGFFIAIFTMTLLSISLSSVLDPAGMAWIIGVCTGFVIWFGSLIASFGCRSEWAKENLSFFEFLWYQIGWENVDILRDFINENGVGSEEWQTQKHTCGGETKAVFHHGTIGIYFGFYVKYFIPIVLLLVLVQTMKDDTINPYGGFAWKYLSVGIIIFSLMVIVVVVVGIFPQIMTQSHDGVANEKQTDHNGGVFSAVDVDEEEEPDEVIAAADKNDDAEIEMPKS